MYMYMYIYIYIYAYTAYSIRGFGSMQNGFSNCFLIVPPALPRSAPAERHNAWVSLQGLLSVLDRPQLVTPALQHL